MNKKKWWLSFALSLVAAISGCGGGGGGSDGAAPPGSNPPPGNPPPGSPPAGWSSSSRISNLRNTFSFEMFTPSVALTSQNVGFVAWNEIAGDCGRVWVNRNAGGTWGAATDIGTTQAIDPHIAANDSGDAVAVWVEREWSAASCTGGISGAEVWVSRYSASSSTWTAPQRISQDAPADFTMYGSSPLVALDASGRALAVWLHAISTGPTQIVYSRFNGTTWSAPAQVSNGLRNTAEPTLGMDAGGNAVAVWRQDTNVSSPSVTNMWAARFNATSSAWSTSLQIGSTDLGTTDGTERPRLAVNAAGNAVAVWREGRSAESRIVSARFAVSSGTWSAAAPIETGAPRADWPWVAIDTNGNAQAVWVRKTDPADANESAYAARFDAGSGVWSAAQLIEQSGELPSTPKVGMEDSGRALIAWQQFISGIAPVHAAHFTSGSGLGTQSHFPGDGLALAVNASGTALLASEVTSFETSFFGISIHAAMFRP